MDLDKAYQILAPIKTHFRKVPCSQAECDGWRNGWLTRLPGNDHGNIDFITSGRTGRHYREIEPTAAGERQFVFSPGQPCFTGSHPVSLEREPLYVVRSGGHRTTRRAVDWVDDFATHQQGIADAIEKG